MKSNYQIVTHIINWKPEVENSYRFGERLKKIQVPSHWEAARETWDFAVPDVLAFLNPRFRPRILETVRHQMNLIFTKLAKDEPRFKGKVSIYGHSLGSVISYDLLTRQRWENFGLSPDSLAENMEKIRNDEAI